MFGSESGSRPTPLPANQGYGSKVRLAFANGEESWEEQADLVAILAEVLESHGHEVITHEGDWLEHPFSGFVILPQLASFHPVDPKGAQTCSTIQVHHPTLIPEGLFEYQHSTGNDASDSIRKGFDQWAQVDFVTLLDAALVQPKTCMTLVMSLPEEDGKPPRKRRAILGPIAHFQSNPPPETEAGDGENHSYCPCCLVTRSFEAFLELFKSEGFVGLRLFALRNHEGEHLADCRLNGEDYEPGAIALKAYATTWPEAGFEFRKQYVIIQTIEATEDEPESGQ